MKIDPRIRRTRQRLHQSLLQLAIERGYDNVTVQDILGHAETARSTFYAHFRDKDDLLLSGFQGNGEPLFGTLFDADNEAEPFAAFTCGLFQHVDHNRELAKAFFGTSSAAMMMGHLRNLIVVETRKLIIAQADQATHPIPAELRVQFVAGAAFSLLTWWIEHDFPHSVRDMSEACRRLIASGLAGAFGARPE